MARESHRDPLNYALYLLGRRGRTRYELKSKLLEKGYELADVEAVLGRLTEMNLLDDRAYARQYARDKVSIYRRGRYRIGMELKLKGVAKELIEQTLEQVDEADELASARSLLQGRRRQWRDLTERKRFERAIQLLQRRGFSGKVIRRAIAELENEV